MIVPTSRFWLLLGLGFVLALGGAIQPGVERLLIPYDVVLFALLVGSRWLAPSADDFRLERECDHVLSVRVQNLVRLQLTYEGRWKTKLFLRDEPPMPFETDIPEFRFSIAPGSTQKMTYRVRPLWRGLEEFEGTYLRVRSILGLADIQYKLPTDQAIRVYPNVKAIREFDLLNQKGRLNLMGIRHSRRRGIGSEFESLREYVDDDFRRIDWKSTARRGKLVVREYEVERNQSVIVCLDMGRQMLGQVEGTRKFDHALDASLMLLHAANVAGDQVGLLVFGESVRQYVAPRKGVAQTGRILDVVHDIQAESVETDFAKAFGYLASKWKRRSLIVIMTDVEDEEQAGKLAAALAPLRSRHLIYVVRVSDPRIHELTDKPSERLSDVYVKSSALWYLAERRNAEARLGRHGFHNLDSEPKELAQALVSAYLKVKETAQL